MRGYSTMSDEERQSILQQHNSVYNGYATLNPNSNMTPLTVGNYANDTGGITVNNRGEISTYKNFAINEDLGAEKILPPNPADIAAHQEIEEDVNDYSPISYVKKVMSGKMSIEDAIKETGMPFILLSNIAKKLSGNPLNIKEIEDDDTNYSEEDPAFNYNSGGPEQFEPTPSDMDPYDEDFQAIQNMFDYEDIKGNGDTGADMMALQKHMDSEFSGKEDMSGEDKAYNFQSDGGNVDVYGGEDDVSESDGETCEQCGMNEEVCKCNMYEAVDEDLVELVKKEKDKISEMFQRFNRFN
jgi:hypothetical protein